ncbi:hypothetical protein GCAAIG_05665 [Candidatus Electronema halotolerans]
MNAAMATAAAMNIAVLIQERTTIMEVMVIAAAATNIAVLMEHPVLMECPELMEHQELMECPERQERPEHLTTTITMGMNTEAIATNND